MSYTGAISDSTTGLSYMNARYYNPATGTFTSQDTYYGSAYSPWTQHLYSYTGGNPVNYTDPTGHRYAEFATMEGEQNHKEAVVSFSQENYDSYKKERDKPKEEHVDGAGITANAYAGALIGISIQGVWDEEGNTATMLSITIGGALGVGLNGGAVFTNTNAKSINDLKGISCVTGGSASYGLGVGANLGGDYIIGNGYSGFDKTLCAGVSPIDIITTAEIHGAVQISFIKYFDEYMLDYYAEYGTTEELNQQVEIVYARLKHERAQKKIN